VAHDFNNILQALMGYAEIVLSDMAEHDPHRADMVEIRKAALHAADLTQQLLAFSRRQLTLPKVLDLNAVVHGAQKMLQRVIGEDIQVVTQLAPDLRRIKADAGQLVQVIMNLAVNARDAMPHGGRLTINTRNRSRHAGRVRHRWRTRRRIRAPDCRRYRHWHDQRSPGTHL